MNKKNLSLAVALCFSGGTLLAAEVASPTTNPTGNTYAIDDIVVISATGFKQKIADSPASISVISREDLEKKSYQNLSEIIRDVPGVTINSSGDQHSDISIRGMDSVFTLMLIDGKPIVGKESADKWFKNGLNQKSMPPIDSIQRIEIIKGPMSSLYGSEAMGGIINIITKKSTDEWRGNIDTSYTLQQNKDFGDYWQTGVSLAGPLIKNVLGLQLDGVLNQKKQDGLELGMYETKDSNINSRLTWLINDSNELNLDHKYLRDNSEERGNDDRGMKIDYKKSTFTLSHDGEYDSLSLATYLLNDDTKHHSRAYEGRHNQNNNKKTFILNSQGSYRFNSNILTLGAQFQNEKLNTWDQGLRASYKRWDVSLFAEDNYAVTNDLTLTLGARFNKNEIYGTHFTPRAYANYHINKNFTVKGGISSGYKNPGLIASAKDSMMMSGGNRGANLGNADLKPETSLNYEAGFSYSNNNNFDANLMAFHSIFKDKIEYQAICSDGNAAEPSTWTCEAKGRKLYLIRKQMNIGKSEINGIEAAVTYKVLENLKLNAGYTFTKSKQKDGEDKGKPLNIMPQHVLNLGVDYALTDKFNLWGRVDYQGKEPDLQYDWGMEKGQASYAMADVGLVYRLNKNARISAGVYNLFNKKLYDEDENRLSTNGRRYAIGFNMGF